MWLYIITYTSNESNKTNVSSCSFLVSIGRVFVDQSTVVNNHQRSFNAPCWDIIDFLYVFSKRAFGKIPLIQIHYSYAHLTCHSCKNWIHTVVLWIVNIWLFHSIESNEKCIFYYSLYANCDRWIMCVVIKSIFIYERELQSLSIFVLPKRSFYYLSHQKWFVINIFIQHIQCLMNMCIIRVVWKIIL